MDKNIISFAGQIASAKTEAGKYLTEYLNTKQFPHLNGQWKTVAFANSLKDLFCSTFDVDREFIEKYKRDVDAPPGFNQNIRSSLQLIGDYFRQIKKSVWVDLLFKINQDTNIVIDDVRYFSELAEIKRRKGIAVLVYRPTHENFIDHPSENQFREYIDMIKKNRLEGPVNNPKIDFDWFMINDGSVEDLYKKIRNDLVPWLKVEFEKQKIN